MNYLNSFKYNIVYVILIVLINSLFVYVPTYQVWGSTFSPADMAVGAVYVLRDLAQRENGHWVIVSMLLGCFISYLLPEKAIAIASLTAFTVGETIDWGIYTYTRKPLSERILWSSLISVPIDSYIFLHMVDMLTWLNGVLLIFSKFMGVLFIWYFWRLRYQKANAGTVSPLI